MDPLLPPEHPPSPGPTPAPPRPVGSEPIICECCGCQLTPNGDYLALSDRAKEWRGQGERIDKLNATIAALREEVEIVNRKLNDAYAEVKKAQESAASSKLW